MTKGVKACIISLIIIIAVSVIFVIVQRFSSRENKAVIMCDNEILYRINLSDSENRKIRVDYENGGYNIIEIKDGTIKVSEADCPDKTCVKSGKLDSDGLPIVCLPHHLIVRYE